MIQLYNNTTIDYGAPKSGAPKLKKMTDPVMRSSSEGSIELKKYPDSDHFKSSSREHAQIIRLWGFHM